MVDPRDLSSLYFSAAADGSRSGARGIAAPYVGPVAVVRGRWAGGGGDGSGNNSNDDRNGHDDNSNSKGRCLVATRAIQAGELLMVTPPLVAADVDEVWAAWRRKKKSSAKGDSDNDDDGDPSSSSPSSSSSSLEAAAEQVLLRACRTAVARNGAVRRSLAALEGSPAVTAAAASSTSTSVRRLLGTEDGAATHDSDGGEARPPVAALSDADILQIIRRNAFGPDFGTFESIELLLQTKKTTRAVAAGDDDGDDDDACFRRPASATRFLGLYPLAAMINHSCVPNAVRVFCGGGRGGGNEEIMVVHACQNVAANEEICWSYVPPIQSHAARRALLSAAHGFVCACRRCQAEAAVPPIDRMPPLPPRPNPPDCSDADVGAVQQRAAAVSLLEATLSARSARRQRVLTHEVQRYLRVSHLATYVAYFNDALPLADTADHHHGNAASALLAVATQLHLALAACHNASTEHLSILHVCYELASRLHVQKSESDNDNNNNKEQSMGTVRFWTEQLKRAILIRYGPVGDNIETVRRLLQHTKAVLRHPNGMDRVADKFI